MNRWWLWALSLVATTRALGLLAIDYGADSFKASYIGPGTPFDVLYNKDSKRKTPSLVAWTGDERLVGGDAQPAATRSPKDAFASVKMTLSPDALSLHRSLYDVNVLEGTGRSPVLQTSKGAHWAIEEVVAMQLAYAKDMALQASKGDRSFHTVITVPHHFGQLERQAILDAAELAGLKVLALLNDGSAVAVNYAMTRTFPTKDAKEIHLFYDSGASSTEATVVAFHTIPAASITARNTTQLQVLGFGHSFNSGGLAIDVQIRDILFNAFEKQHANKLKTPLKNNDRAMAKLLKEAARVKHILSANQEAVSRIENLAEDVDFKTVVTRQQLEEACASLTPLLEKPVADALAMAGISADALTSAVLVGGSSRVPLVQAAVKNILPESKLAFNLNADEAAVMGAALQGAVLSAQFKTKDIRVEDKTSFGVQAASDSDKTVVFPLYSVKGQKTTLEYKQLSNFTVNVEALTAQDAAVPLFVASVTGFEAALANLTEAEISNSTAKFVLSLSDSGIVSVDKAFVALPERTSTDSVADRIKNLFGGSKDKDKKEGSEEQNDAAETLKSILKAAEDKPLKVAIKHASGYRPMSLSELGEAKKRLRDLEAAELRKKRREEARNDLESYLYRVRDLIETPAFAQASTTLERNKIKDVQETTSEWLWDGGEEAPTKDLRAKKSELERLVKIVQARLDEASERPLASALLESALGAAESFHTSAVANYTSELAEFNLTRHTPEELAKLKDLVSRTQDWFAQAKAKQEKLTADVDPVLKKAELQRRAKDLQTEIERLGKKKRPRKPYVPPTASSATPPSSTTESDAEATRKKDEL